MDPVRTLEDADRLRDGDPDRALAIYCAADPRAVVEDPSRRDWILARLPANPPEALRPFLRHVVDHGSGEPLRRSLALLARSHWYATEFNEARRLWERAAELGREERDQDWVVAVVNLSLIHARESRVFEALPMVGAVERRATELGDHATATYAKMRRGWMLVAFEEWELAERALEEAGAALANVEDERKRLQIESDILAARARMQCARGDCRSATGTTTRQIEILEAMGEACEPALIVGAHSQRLRHAIHSSPDPAERRALLEDLRTIPERFPFDPRWRPIWEFDVRWATFEVARREPTDRDELVARGTELVASVVDVFSGEERIDRLLHLAEQLEAVDAHEAVRHAIQVAADTAVERMGSLRASLESMTDLVEPTPEDRAIFARVSDRLSERYRVISESLQRVWSPGDPVHDWVVGEGEFIRACGWCRRVNTSTGEWIPVSQFIPESRAARVTHGICPECVVDQKILDGASHGRA